MIKGDIMKYEWKKHEKDLYLPKEQPEVVTVPPLKFFTLSGQRNPNSEGFAEEVGVLYSLSYAVKMLPKKNITPKGYFDYTVFPLEGVWDLPDEAKSSGKLDKDKLVYKIMIRQPEFVTDEIAKAVIEMTKQKKPGQIYDRVNFEIIEEGICVQMMHVGSYDSEPESFQKMHDYCLAHNLKRISQTHREIYISDPKKTKPDKLKTVLRFKVEQI